MKKIMKKIRNRLIPIQNDALRFLHRPPKIAGNEQTIAMLAGEGKSLGRFGDGEMMLILGSGDLSFQKQDAQLACRLEEVLRSREEHFLVGIPDVFTNKSLEGRNESSSSFWMDNLRHTRLEWYRRLSFSRLYASSTFTRNYVTLKDKSPAEAYFLAVRKIWENRKVLMIEGCKSRVGVGNDLFAGTVEVKRIICPACNAFDAYDQILAQALSMPRDYLVLIALGPTATVLAYDLYKAGYQAIDIGHMDIEFEWFLRKSEKWERISGKWVAETGGMEEDVLSEDRQYLSEIIGTVEA